MKTIIRCLLGLTLMLGTFTVAQVSFSSEAEARRVVKAHGGRKIVRHSAVRANHIRRHNRRVARGVAVGVGVGVAVGVAAGSYRYSCRDLAYRCNRGNISACVDHDTYC